MSWTVAFDEKENKYIKFCEEPTPEEDLPTEPTQEEKIEELKSQVTALQAEILKIGGSI